MPYSCRRILFPLLLVFVLPLSGCMSGIGSGSQYKFSTTTTVIAPATSVTEGQPVILEADISGGANASGTVTFYSGSNAIGTAQVSSNFFYFSLDSGAQLSTTFSSSGVQSITAKYSGDQFNSPSTSQVVSIGVYSNQLAATSVTLQASTTTPQYQTNVTLTAAVSPSSATGTVTFYNGTADIGSSPVNDGSASLTTSFQPEEQQHSTRSIRVTITMFPAPRIP